MDVRHLAVRSTCPLRPHVLLTLVLCLGAGCARYGIIRSEGYLTREQPDVVETAKYHEVITTVRRVAVLEPSFCAPAGQPGSTHLSKGTVLVDNCAVYLSEMEKALSQVGLEMVWWSDLSQVMQAQGLTALEAARAKDVEVVFQLNSVTMGRTRSDIDFRRSYFESDEGGRVLGQLDGGAAAGMEAAAGSREDLVRRAFHQAAPRRFCGAAMHVDAINVQNSQKVWFFYGWRLPPFSASIETLARRAGGGWVAVPVLRRDGTLPGLMAPAAVSGPLFDPRCDRDSRGQMIREIAIELASRFRKQK